ncbi:ABC transporter substrate-binding protein [Photobacterium gaetbulicola]|uniref:ABC transporter substrate-binding protein n=1 Tax=Photobacterium gaetbulicola TaxID=1295392 RepID=A0A0B9GZI2_9GAMM|nr:ABC transporter permease [Photobacterium gaetbulicola]KHT62052.1 ABC transporter substrate-binding protein [Photobacterium gaetbulicola]
MLLKLAWRNIWRQKRRTLLTASALALALALSLFMRSLQEGTYANNIENAARFYTGLIQLQHPEFAESHSIDDLLVMDESFLQPVLANVHINRVLPRIESFALAASADKSKGVMVLGVDTVAEDSYSGISNRLIRGAFLAPDDQQVLVGEGLARYFGLDVGDELILYGQGYRGQTAAGLYRIKGILDFPVAQLDNQLVYMPIALAQTLYSTGEQVTAWVMDVKPLAQLQQTVDLLGEAYRSEVNVRDWQDLAPEMAQQILMDKAGGIFIMYLLYGVVGFGLFATLLMMTLERQREFGVMLATGMLKRKIIALLGLESLMIGWLGIAMGMAITLPVLIWFYFNPIELTGETAELVLEMGWEPILPMSLDPVLMLNQMVIVLGLLAICLIYPMWRIRRLDVVRALKGGGHAN